MGKNANLRNAKSAKNDEFYTRIEDVEKELKYYKDFFKGKKVLCNCNDGKINGEWSAFAQYFSMNFEHLGLKKLTCISYNEDGHGMKYVYQGDKNGNHIADDIEWEVTELDGHGDFSDEEGQQMMQECDVVVTNPPFSLFRDFVAQLVKYDKKFLIIGNKNAITYKEVFPLIKENKLWIGCAPMGQDIYFALTDKVKEDMLKNKKEGSAYKIVNGEIMGRAQACWFTNIPHSKRNQPLDLYKKYNPKDYPKYDNYDAINVNKTSDIPMDYDGVMGVPITFLDKYCPTQFEIVGGFNGYKDSDYENGLLCGTPTLYIDKNGAEKTWNGPTINKKSCYYRVLIRRK